MSEINGNGVRVKPGVQSRILAVLADGMRHTWQEMIACLGDDLGTRQNVSYHLTFIRKVLNPRGEDVVVVARNGTSYVQHVRLLEAACKGGKFE